MPIALRYGVPESIFWNLNPKRLEPWERMYEFKEQLRRDEEDYAAWIHGQYILAAIGAAIDGKKSPYPAEPFSVTQRRDEEEMARQTAVDRFAAFAMAFNAGFKRKQEMKENT